MNPASNLGSPDPEIKLKRVYSETSKGACQKALKLTGVFGERIPLVFALGPVRGTLTVPKVVR